ncbi:hypothetical protein OKA05_20770 [Luteolibacter arcticus]|uniref:HEAT repeat domain-containing protein n=1 Tax=Luteolibacter arcticus TaxID=1581411 RepID=A0ABT3GND8_9BACT|nr:hypothetical protein [Luteolibacter arcticus]MCW1925008.1 hypothetical protein [Luteolibacter arcticus]
MKRKLLIPGILASSTVIGLIQWSNLQHLREEIARAPQQIPSPARGGGRLADGTFSAGNQAPAGDADPVSELKKLLVMGRGDTYPNGVGERNERYNALLKQMSPDALARVLMELEAGPDSHREFQILQDYVVINPRGAVEVALGLSERIEQHRDDERLSHLFDLWTRQEAGAALAWLRAEESRIPAEIRDGMFRDAFIQQAASDPRQALADIAGEDRIANRETGETMGYALQDPETVRAIFKAMDEMAADPAKAADLAPVREGLAGALHHLFDTNSFSAAAGVIDECLTADEKAAFVNSCNENGGVYESPKWADWLMGFEPSPGETPHPLVTRMQSWANEDPNSAGAWLDQMPESPMKEETIAAYAEGLRKRDPARAAEWAVQLPEDERRDQVIEKIAAAWEKGDPDAARNLRQTHLSGH